MLDELRIACVFGWGSKKKYVFRFGGGIRFTPGFWGEYVMF